MQIDWFTLAAQAVNFLVLLALLKILIYDRVIEVMDRREERIASRLREGEKKREEAENLRAEYEEKLEEIDRLREREISRVRKEGEKEKNRYLREARQEVEENRRSWEEDLEREKKQFLDIFRKRIGEEVYSIARKTLADLADHDLEKKVTDTFIEKVRNLEGDEKKKIEEAGEETKEKVVVESSFALDDERRAIIEELMKTMTGREVEFVLSDDTICGITMYVNGLEAGWSMDRYINEMEEIYRELITNKGDLK